jgi:hypothetical protein
VETGTGVPVQAVTITARIMKRVFLNMATSTMRALHWKAFGIVLFICAGGINPPAEAAEAA